MINVSNYYNQAHGLLVNDKIQLFTLMATDFASIVREAGKISTSVALVSLTAGVVFNFDSTIPCYVYGMGRC